LRWEGRGGGEILEIFSKNKKIELIRKINFPLQDFFGGKGAQPPPPRCYTVILRFFQLLRRMPNKPGLQTRPEPVARSAKVTSAAVVNYNVPRALLGAMSQDHSGAIFI